MNHATYSRPRQQTVHMPIANARILAATLGAAIVAFALFDIDAMRSGLNSTNAGLQTSNAQLRLTNQQLRLTNAQLRHTNQQLGMTNWQLRFTNAQISSTNNMGGQLAAMRNSLQQMTKKIVHAKLLF